MRSLFSRQFRCLIPAGVSVLLVLSAADARFKGTQHVEVARCLVVTVEAVPSMLEAATTAGAAPEEGKAVEMRFGMEEEVEEEGEEGEEGEEATASGLPAAVTRRFGADPADDKGRSTPTPAACATVVTAVAPWKRPG